MELEDFMPLTKRKCDKLSCDGHKTELVRLEKPSEVIKLMMLQLQRENWREDFGIKRSGTSQSSKQGHDLCKKTPGAPEEMH